MPQPLLGRLTPRRLLAALVLPVLLLTGCADEPGEAAPSTSDVVTSDVAEVEVEGEFGEKPTVAYDGTFETETTERVVLEEGEGEPVALGQKVQLNYLGVNGKDGTEFDTSFGNPEPASFVLEQGQLIDGFITGLEGVAIGSRVLVGISPDDGYGPAGGQPDAGIGAEDSLLFVIDVLDATTPLKRATGSAAEPLGAGLPAVVLAENGAPTITPPSGPPPTKLVIRPLIVGAGPAVAEGQTLSVHYTLVSWASGEVIESSWTNGTPVSLPLVQGQVMKPIIAGLGDKTVGSQVMLVVPPAEASEGAAEPVTETLVFVFDILDAQ